MCMGLTGKGYKNAKYYLLDNNKILLIISKLNKQ